MLTTDATILGKCPLTRQKQQLAKRIHTVEVTGSNPVSPTQRKSPPNKSFCYRALHTGRYPFRTGHYAFQRTPLAPDFVKPVVFDVMRDHGYAAVSLGMIDQTIFQWGPGQGFNDAGLFDHRIQFRNHPQKNG